MKSFPAWVGLFLLIPGLAANLWAQGVATERPASPGILPVASTLIPSNCVPPPAGMVAWWPGEGNANDIVGANNGSAQAITYAPGEVGQAFVFNGSSSQIRIPASPSLNVGTSQTGFTVEAWINPADFSFQSICEWNANGEANGGFGAGEIGTHLELNEYNADGSLWGNIVDTSGISHIINTAGGVIAINTFQHVAMTYDETSGMAVLYWNGLAVTNVNLGVFTPQTSSDFFIGNRPAGPFAGIYFHGEMDELSLYNRPLSAAEIQAIYAAGSAGKCVEPIPPFINSQPANLTATVNGAAIFNVAATGTQPLDYQWSFDGTNISGATNSTLILSEVQFAQAGNYSVLVSNVVGWAASSNAVLTVQPAPPCTPPPAGIVGWWQGEGNADDFTGVNNGVLQGGLGFAAGEVGQAFAFTATNQDVLVPASPSLDVGDDGTGFTLEAWINPSEVSAGPYPIFEWHDLTGWWGVHFHIIANQPTTFWSPGPPGPGQLYANIVGNNGWNQIASAAGTVVTNEWQHVALTYDETAGVATLYYNGQIVNQLNLGSFTPQTTYPLFIGRRIGTPADEEFGTFSGLLDEAAVYNRALGSNEIAALYAAGSAGKCNEPIPPEIVTQPASQTVLAGGTAAFGVGAAGTGPLAYQWTLAGHNIVGATNTWLSLTNLHPVQAGNYAVKITSPYGSITSSNAQLTVVSQNLLIYKYAGEETIVTKGEELSFPYSGMMFFVPDHTNGAYVGWATIQGKRSYWINSISQSLWINIPGNASQSYTLFGDAGSGFDDNGQAHFRANLLKGWNTTLAIGTRKTFVFPNTFAGENIHAYPDAQTGQMKLDQASSTFTFAGPNTQTANNTGQTLADLINAQVKLLKSEGYLAQ